MNLALLSFRIIAMINFALALVLLALSFKLENGAMLAVLGVFAGGWGYFATQIRSGLSAGRYWAWVAGVIVAGLQIMTLAFPLGIMGLVGLLNVNTRRAFNEADRLALS